VVAVRRRFRTEPVSAFLVLNYAVMLLVLVVTLYPFLYVLSASLSDPQLVMRGMNGLLPRGFTLFNYRYVFTQQNILQAYWNTIRYTVVGTLINIFFTMSTAFPLSRKRFPSRGLFMKLILFTMLFSGGLIPTYLVIRSLGMVNKIWALVIPGAVSAYYLIVARTFLNEVPESLEESAIIDGANDIQVYFRIFLPLSKAIIATLALFYAVGHWNSFFAPLIYLNDKKKYPLQILLRGLLVSGGTESAANTETERSVVMQSIRYTAIIVATLPILFVYPFIQKYFVKGVMIGSIKG
jgi:putative aldouronate transport system permease protein